MKTKQKKNINTTNSAATLKAAYRAADEKWDRLELAADAAAKSADENWDRLELAADAAVRIAEAVDLLHKSGAVPSSAVYAAHKAKGDAFAAAASAKAATAIAKAVAENVARAATATAAGREAVDAFIPHDNTL